MLALLTMSPFLLMPLAAWLGKQRRGFAALLAIWPAILALYFASLMSSVAISGSLRVSVAWAESLGLVLSFYADGLSLLFAVLITAIGSLIVLFSSRYFDGDARAGRFAAILFAFMGSMLGVVLADNLFALFVFWELTGFTSFLLIGFDQDRPEARSSAVQALVVTGTGGIALLAAAVLMEQGAGSSELSVLLAKGVHFRGAETYSWIAALVMLAAFTKSAQTPFHFWLPNAMTAPTPVSAYLHSATMVKAGLYLVARLTPVLGATPVWTGLVTSAGAVTMVIGAWRSVAETDLKRVLAYSTVSALGVVMMLLGPGTEPMATAALVYLAAHACYKGALFLVAGTLEHETGTRDVTELGGLWRSMPIVALAGGLAACSMAGIPLFFGFISKELAYEALLGRGQGLAQAILALTVTVSALLGAAGLIAGVAPFTGSPGKAVAAHKVSWTLSAPPLVLAAAGLAGGLLPAAIDAPISLAVSSMIREAQALHLTIWHGITPAAALSLLTLAAAAALYRWRDAVRRRMLPGWPGFELLYSGSLRAMDAISTRIAPALQSGSLRSYVLVLIVTAALLVAVVLVWTGLPPLRDITEIRPPEAAAALMTIAGAVSAVRARATITAVVSLGIAGYGIALTFLFFGAPDLAMTQFSVETLTAIIFTLVFYHFRRFRSVSPRLIRLRDFFVAALFGSSIAVVLFFVGTFPTPFRLGGYFAEASVPLAHGRNIVNVILVDFRALDTLGEITVLATAAAGVRAVLELGRQERKKR